MLISNQSFEIDPVDILIRVDDNLIVDKKFFVENQHTYQTFEISLPKGTHTIYAETKAGNAQLKEEFVIDEDLWIAISFVVYDGQLS